MGKLVAGDYVSVIRNRKIADMFKEAGLIEKYGTGIRRILQGFSDFELLKPKFEEIGGGFRVSVYRGEERAVASERTPSPSRYPSSQPRS
jgi:ATP-dependent DNA helicase RecG